MLDEVAAGEAFGDLDTTGTELLVREATEGVELPPRLLDLVAVLVSTIGGAPEAWGGFEGTGGGWADGLAVFVGGDARP